MRKGKLGLQKEVSKIFTGISVPGKKTAEHPLGEQIPKVDAGKGVLNQPVVEPQTVPSVTPKQGIKQPTVAPAVKEVPTEPASVLPGKEVVIPEATIVTPSQVVKPTTVESAATVETVTLPGVVKRNEKPVAQTQKHFTIPEPPQTKAAEVKSPVYEPPVRKQAVYEPPKPTAPISESTVRQQKVEIITVASTRQNALLNILKPLADKLLAPQPGVSPLRQKVTLAILVILPLVSIFILFKVFNKPARGNAKAVKTTASAAASKQINWQLPPPLPENFRDPMVFGSSGQGQQEQEGPVVKGIVYSEDNPCAVVGERIVTVGDTVGGATIVKINPDSVEFASGDKRWSQKVER